MTHDDYVSNLRSVLAGEHGLSPREIDELLARYRRYALCGDPSGLTLQDVRTAAANLATLDAYRQGRRG